MRPDCDYYILYAPDVGQVRGCSRRSHFRAIIILYYVYIYYHRRNGRDSIARSSQRREEWWMTESIAENEHCE